MSSNAKTQTCGTCKYFVINKMKLDQGECRHSPPSATTHILQGNRQIILTSFPSVMVKDWGCHQYEPKLEVSLEDN